VVHFINYKCVKLKLTCRGGGVTVTCVVSLRNSVTQRNQESIPHLSNIFDPISKHVKVDFVKCSGKNSEKKQE